MTPLNKIYCEPNIETMKRMDDGSIDSLITSPPYWGLRDYGKFIQVWGGSKECEHEFIDYDVKLQHENRQNLDGGTLDAKGTQKFREGLHGLEAGKAGFCPRCNAWKGQLGLEPTFQLYLEHLWLIFDEVYRVLKKTGTCWVNLGDTYHNATKWTNKAEAPHTISNGNNRDFNTKRRDNQGLPEKCLCGIPERFMLGMIDRGWILRNKIIWYKRNCMPASVRDRFTVDFEDVFFFVKNKSYYFEQQFEKYDKPLNRWGGDKTKETDKTKGNNFAVLERVGRERRPNEQGRNKRCVWDITPKPFKEAHFAVYPEELVEPMIKAGCPEFVCKKCGKAREKIYKTEVTKFIPREEEKYSGGTEFMSKKTTLRSETITKDLGLTDCECNEGFEGGIVYDPFMGSGTTALVSKKLGRNFIGSEINPDYVKIAERRISTELHFKEAI